MTKSKDLLVGVAGLILGVMALVSSLQMQAGPQLFPRFVSIFILVVSAYIVIEALMKPKAESKPGKPADYKSVGAIIAILFAYYFLFQWIGYTIPTFFLIFLSAMVLGYRNMKVMTITSAAISIGLYVIFTKVFDIRFPEEFLPDPVGVIMAMVF